MYLYRYMSQREFADFNAGLEIVGSDRARKSATFSEGVCFLGETTDFVSEWDESGEVVHFDPLSCLYFLVGIVTGKDGNRFDRDFLLCCFETEEPVMEADACYANPYTSDWDDCIQVVEYSTPSYSKDSFKLRGYSLVRLDDRTEDTVWYL